jgi:hypothetical protein
MAPTALNSANTDYEGLELVVEWLKAHSDSRNDSLTFEGTLNDTGYAGLDRVADWSQASSDSRNEDDELANRVAAADLAADPRQRLDPNGRFICTHEGCGMTFRCTQVLRRHEEKHNPAGFHCEQCNYSTYWKDMLRHHRDRRHKHNMDFLKCQKCNYETYYKNDLREHQGRHEQSGTAHTRQ